MRCVSSQIERVCGEQSIRPCEISNGLAASIMSYSIKEIFYTLQGEGHNAGRPAVFCRFAGCNLWSGHEKDRAEAICQFCDTDFVGTDGEGGARFETASEVAQAVSSKWTAKRSAHSKPLVVCTGGEPLLQ